MRSIIWCKSFKFEKIKNMKIIHNKQEAIKELIRISARTTSESNNSVNSIVQDILQEVKVDGDKALEKYTKKFDGFNPNPMQVSSNDLSKAWNETKSDLKSSLEIAYERIKNSMKRKFQLLLL